VFGLVCLVSVAAAATTTTTTTKTTTNRQSDPVQQAGELLKAGRYEEATAAFDSILGKDPTNAAAMAGLGEGLMALGRLDESIEVLERGTKAHPDHFDLHYLLGSGYYNKAIELSEAGRPGTVVGSILNDSASRLRRAIEIDSNQKDAWVRLGMVQAYQNESAEAEKSFLRAVEIDPKDVFAWWQLGETRYNAENYDTARAAYEKTIEIDPKEPAYYQKLGFCYQFLEKFDKAEETYRRGLAANPAAESLWTSYWDLYAGKNDFPAAIASYKKLIEAHPKLALAHVHLGHVYDLLDVDDKALEEFEKALRLEPKNAAAMLQIGKIHERREEYDKAIVAFDKALELAPGFAAANEALGNVAGQLVVAQRFPEAEKILKKLLASDPENGYINASLGLVYRDWGKYDEALKYYEKVYELLPDDAQMINDYALMLDYHFNRSAEALPIYLKAVEIDENVDAMQNLCRLYVRNGQYEEAIRVGERALKKDPARDEIRGFVNRAKDNLRAEGKQTGSTPNNNR
jgi:tetratricopeptide (TPR) repeat protein